MEIIVIDESMKKQWEDFVYENPYSIAWQSYEWKDVLKRHYNVKFIPLAVIEDSKIIGILPLYLIENNSGRASLISVPYAVAGGIVSDNKEAANLLLKKAVEFSRQYDSCNITLKQYKKKIQGELRTDDNYYNRELSLTSDLDEMRSRITEFNRQKIEESENYNLMLEYPSQNIKVFYDLLLRHQHRNGIPCVRKRWIEDLVDFKMYSIALLKYNNKYVAGTMVKEFKKTISFPFTCLFDGSERSHLFAYNLYWQLIKKYASEGMEIFHSGRIPNDDHADIYRLGWGGTKYTYYYQYYPKGIGQTEFTKRRGWKRELFTIIWKIMPLPAARFIGQYIVKRFP